jgi:hypothetical protein
MRVCSIEVATHNYLKNSIRAYFEGQRGCNLRWILGLINHAAEGSREQARVILETRLGQYAGSQAYLDLLAQL